VTRASTAIGVSPIIKDLVQKKALATRLTLKEIIYVGMLAIDDLDEKRLQELADQVHQMQVNGEIWGLRAIPIDNFYTAGVQQDFYAVSPLKILQKFSWRLDNLRQFW